MAYAGSKKLRLDSHDVKPGSSPQDMLCELTFPTAGTATVGTDFKDGAVVYVVQLHAKTVASGDVTHGLTVAAGDGVLVLAQKMKQDIA